MDKIIIKGAREHNLQNINLEIPKNKFVVFTGISGSGKSSLAFDTIYAEGQRRYVESLSAYARQFLGIMNKPDVDMIEGLSPAISIDQKTVSHNPRSTIGTITEIYDYLRLLYARIGHPHCHNCGREIRKLSLDEIIKKVTNEIVKHVQDNKLKPHQFFIFSPVVRQRKGEFKDLFNNLLSKGFNSIRIDGKETSLNDDINLIKTNKHTIDVITDKISITFKDIKNEVYISTLRSRLTTTIEQSLNLSDGLVILACPESIRQAHDKSDPGRASLAKITNEYLYSEKFSCPNCNISLPEIEPRMFSFNSPLGACELCKGIGSLYKIDTKAILNNKLSINEGGILPFNKIFFQETWYTRLLKQVSNEESVDLDLPIEKLTKVQLNLLLNGTGKVYRVPGTNRYGKQTVIYEEFNGIVAELEKRYFDPNSNFSHMEIGKYMKEEICTKCKGKKLKDEILAITIDGINISDMSDESIANFFKYIDTNLKSKLNTYEQQIAKPILKEINVRLNFLSNVGLSYLTISRLAKTLSGGELQRIRLASQIGTGLTGVLYVLDEPSIGLHPKDVTALVNSLKNLRDLGNTLIIVEHDRETIEAADYSIELGPYAGKHGGKVIFHGTVKEMIKNKQSLTGKYLTGSKKIASFNKKLNENLGRIILSGANQFNLKNIKVNIPLGNLIGITGVSGSGKSTLIVETLYPALKYYLEGYYQDKIGKFNRIEGYQYIDRVYLVDQSPIGRTPRSNPATYVGFFDDIRETFAITLDSKAKGFKKGRFSFNLKGGRCEKCQGAGVIKIEMQFLPDVYVECDICQGRRYNQETLNVKFKNKNIYDILKMTVDEATDFFFNFPKIYRKLVLLKQVGLGYIELGQQAPTLSGGEAQRIKLGSELSRDNKGKTLYILDEPTTGLHFYDIEKLMLALNGLVEKGNTVIVIEHNLDVIKNCQYLIDLGPEGGDKGGYVVYEGETKSIVREKKSYTGQYLKKYL